MSKNANSSLRLPALEIRQGPRRTLYTFAVDGKELANFATISRIGRTEEHAIKGYQRPEVLSFVMDAIADRHRKVERLTVKQFREDIEPLKEICRWTDGYWDFGPGAQLKWNGIQNTPRHVQMLANYLLVQYKARVWNRVER